MGKKYHNRYDLNSFDYGIGYTRSGIAFMFDKEDYDLIKDKCWHTINNESKNRIYIRCVCDDYPNGIFLHRLIMNIENNNKVVIDHINHNTLDNRKKNLRIVTQQQNVLNTSLRSDNTSGAKGVYLDKRYNKWYCQITFNGHTYTKRLFDTKEEAIQVRRELEEKYFGENSYDFVQKNAIQNEKLKNITDERNITKGVLWREDEQVWISYIQINKNRYNLGTYRNYEDALKARKKAEEQYCEQNLKEGDDEDDLF